MLRVGLDLKNGARFLHDELVAQGWEVLIADAQRVRGSPLSCKTHKIDARVLAMLSFYDLVPAIWLLTRGAELDAGAPRGGCTWSSIARRSRTQLATAIWYMLTRNQLFAPAGATFRLAA